MLKHVKFSILAIGVFFSCLTIHAGEYKPPAYGKYVKEITNEVAQEIEEELNLVCIGSGGSMPNDVESIQIMFVAYRHGTIEEARRLEVVATEKLLKSINEHEKIRPFLREYPFNAERAQITISFRKNDDSAYKDSSVALVLQVRNKIYFRGDDGVSPIYISLGEEPFEDAQKLVHNTSILKARPQS